eukprot:7326-Pelagococcus_subviridis.AAC.3
MSALAASSTSSANAKTCSAPGTSSAPPRTPALASSIRRPKYGVATHAAESAAPTSSVRACASDGLDDARWFATRSPAPRRPTTRGMSASSNPGIPSVKRNTAKSSSCAAARAPRGGKARRGRWTGARASSRRRRARRDVSRGAATDAVAALIASDDDAAR